MTHSRLDQWAPRVLLLCLLAGAADGCERRGAPAVPARPPVTESTSTLRGRATYQGPRPALRPVDRHSDPYCERTPHVDESILVGARGGLGNVLVRLIGAGLPESPPPPANPVVPVVIEQRECAYRPRVLGMRAGQQLQVRNLDGTLHNVHVFRGTQTVLNRSQKEGSAPAARDIEGPAAILEVKCDVHPWMISHVGVSEHPWFAVTGEDGTFQIAHAPPGRYAVEAWHEVLGTRTAEVDVPVGGAATVDFTFVAPAAAR